ncbi:hypothetical protein F01_140134 [Burkholderia cenocepacia]|nr:hypothetical protein F01_140134 [Burkholderia cenocepacia]
MHRDARSPLSSGLFCACRLRMSFAHVVCACRLRMSFAHVVCACRVPAGPCETIDYETARALTSPYSSVMGRRVDWGHARPPAGRAPSVHYHKDNDHELDSAFWGMRAARRDRGQPVGLRFDVATPARYGNRCGCRRRRRRGDRRQRAVDAGRCGGRRHHR